MSLAIVHAPKHRKPASASEVTVTNWDGTPVTLTVPVAVDALGNISFTVPQTGTYKLVIKKAGEVGVDTVRISALAAENSPVSGQSAAENQLATFLVRNPDSLVVGAISRDANHTMTSASVKWPDGTPGVYTLITASTTALGQADSYSITYGVPAIITYTQPTLTRDAGGNVTNRPAITAA